MNPTWITSKSWAWYFTFKTIVKLLDLWNYVLHIYLLYLSSNLNSAEPQLNTTPNQLNPNSTQPHLNSTSTQLNPYSTQPQINSTTNQVNSNIISTWPHINLNLNLNLNSALLQPQTQINLSFNLNSTWLWHKSNPILFLKLLLKRITVNDSSAVLIGIFIRCNFRFRLCSIFMSNFIIFDCYLNIF